MKNLFEIRNLEMVILKKISNDSFIRENNITPVQCEILNYLITNQIIYQKDIESKLNIRRSTISGVLHTMEKNGLIKKEYNKSDARVNKIIITKKGMDINNTLKEKLKLINDIAFFNISDDEVNNFYNTINKIIKNLER